MELPAAERAKGDELDDDADDAGADHRDDEDHRERQDAQLRGGDQHEGQPDVRADHRDFPVREVQEVQHAEDQRVADGDEGIAAAQHQPIDDLLDERRDRGHPGYLPTRLRSASIFAWSDIKFPSRSSAWR